MGALRVLRQIPNDDHYDRLAAKHNALLEEEQWVSKSLGELERRFVEGDLVVQSGARKGKPLTRAGRLMLWDRIQSLLWRQLRLLDEQKRLYRMATGWSEHDREGD